LIKGTRKGQRSRNGWQLLLLVALVALTFYPFIFMLMTSLKDNGQFYHSIWTLGRPLHVENYVVAWDAMKHYVLNSFIVTISSVFGVIAFSLLSSYAFARHTFYGKEVIFVGILSLLMVPSVLTLVSGFMWLKHFPLAGGNNLLGLGGTGLVNTRWGLILPYIAGGQVFAIFVLRSFISALPEDLFEAARIDGAGELSVLRHVVIPLCKPILSTVAIMNILSTWNDYVWPLLIISDDAKRTLAVGVAFFQGTYGASYGPMMAGYTIASLPLLVLFLFAMRQFVQGLTTGALRA
jgi:ABC-type glycerol-3-phosphate transport system permease component